MAFMPYRFAKAKGCSFAKLMGSGAGEGFSLKPNFSKYALIMHWETQEYLESFLEGNKAFLYYRSKSTSFEVFRGWCFSSRGLWDGHQPFKVHSKPQTDTKIMVLTRATIRWSRMIQFWKFVPATSLEIGEAQGKIFSIGIGELPWIRQATISIWESEEAIRKFAYNSPAHMEAIKKTKELDWYKEELFARFSLVE